MVCAAGYGDGLGRCHPSAREGEKAFVQGRERLECKGRDKPVELMESE